MKTSHFKKHSYFTLHAVVYLILIFLAACADETSENRIPDDKISPSTQCNIQGRTFVQNEINPDSPCLVCDTSLDPFDWSVATGAVCDDGQECTRNDVCGQNAQCRGERQLLCTEMVQIPEGPFWMGCEPNWPDLDCTAEEFPRHQVMLSTYSIEQFEVTNAQYAAYLNEKNPSNDCFGERCAYSMHPTDLGLFESGGVWKVDETFENHPVIGVTWYGAQSYCESMGLSLPTDAQWEKAAKGSEQNYYYPWGDFWAPNAGNWVSNNDPYENGPQPQTTPVGFFDGATHQGYATLDGSSPYGVHDMAGNVWEWIYDWFGEGYYQQTPPNGWINPRGPETGIDRIDRGGARNCLNGQYDLRASYRHNAPPNDYFNDTGFRCATTR